MKVLSWTPAERQQCPGDWRGLDFSSGVQPPGLNLRSAKWKPPGPEPVVTTLHTSIRAASLSLRFLDCKIWLVILQARQSILSCLASHRSGPQQVLFLPIFSFLPSLWYSVTHTHTHTHTRASLVVQMVKNLPAMQQLPLLPYIRVCVCMHTR